MRDENMEAIALEVGKRQWEQKKLQKRMDRSVANLLSKYQPGRGTKHPKGATKQTTEARKAKNRARRKANKR